MKKSILFTTIILTFVSVTAMAQTSVFDPNDPIEIYDPGNPRAIPPFNRISKWVHSYRADMAWMNTSRFKCYFYNGMAFRLRFPNGYNPADPNKKYPIIVFFHGGGETAPVTDNEYHLLWGALPFESYMNGGAFDAFMLFPQSTSIGWDRYLSPINDVLDSLQQYCNMDPDRVISMGLSIGGNGALAFPINSPQRVATAIASAPALLNGLRMDPTGHIHIPMWVASGGADLNPNPLWVKTFVDSISNRGGNVQWNYYPTEGHLIWNQHWDDTPYHRLFSYWNAAHKANPLVFYNQTQFAATVPLNVRIGVTGGFSQYQWQKDGADIPGGFSNEIIATQFGSYRVRFKRTPSSNWSEWSPRPAVLSLSPDATPPSAPPGLQALYSGRNYVNLDWGDATDNSGIAGYDVYVDGIKRYSIAESAVTVDNLSPNTTYTFTVKARDIPGNVSSTFSNPVTATTTPAASGLNYRYYHGTYPFDLLPNFNTLTPVRTGTSSNVDISVRNPGVNDAFAFVWEGYINMPSAGTYTFETGSDDGSKLYFNSFYNPGLNALVSNDGLHATAPTASGTVNVPAAGTYPIAIIYFEKGGGEGMEVYWSGPNLARQAIPNSAFTGNNNPPPVDNTAPSVPGNVYIVSSSTNSINLDWDNSTDNVGVTGYDVYVNGAKLFSPTQSAVTVDNLAAGTTYTFTIKARDLVGNTSAFSSPVSASTTSPTTTTSGLSYKYYEGTWNTLPDFNTLTPVKTGSTPNVDLGVRTAGRDDRYGFVWEGYINITVPGVYTFETTSDDGSAIYFNSAYSASATPLLINDGIHGAESVSGTVNITSAGAYPIAITFFENSGGEMIQVKWAGPGFAKQPIPNNAFTTTNTNPPPASSGLTYKYYEGTWTTLPNFNSLTPVKTGSTPNIDLGVRTAGRNDNYAFVWEGYITITAAGTYNFETVSDDGSMVFLNTAYSPTAAPLVNNDGLHASKSALGSVSLAAGVYPITITFFENSGGELMQLFWEGPGIGRQPVPNNVLTSTSTGAPPPPPPGSGLTFKYYEGTWNVLPDFTLLTPVKTGSTPNIDLGVRTAGRNDRYGFVWEGNITITTPGTYIFETISDDGSKFYFNSLYSPNATALVYNDGLHGSTSATGSVTIAAGVYPVAITFFENSGGESMQLYYSGPGIGRQPIPNSAFTAANSSIPPPAIGLTYKYYEGSFSALPNFNTLSPVKTGSTLGVDIGVRNPGVNDNYAFLWEGYINITSPGTYTFETASDDGSKFYFNSVYSHSGIALVNNDGLHATKTVAANVDIPLAGLYPVAITFFEQGGGENMQVNWAGPGISKQPIPSSAFRQTNTITGAVTNVADMVLGNESLSAETSMLNTGKEHLETTGAYPNPFTKSFNISFYNTAATNRISVRIYDLTGRMLSNRYFGNLATGKNILLMDATTRQLSNGIYFVRIDVNGIPSKVIKMVKELR